MKENHYLVKNNEIDKLAGHRKKHFLNSNAQCTYKSLGDMTGLTGFGFHIMELEPGHDSTEFHFHYNEDECVFVLSGNGTARTGNHSVPLSAGDFLGYRKGGLAHTIKNTGVDMLKCIVVGQRLESDVVEYPESKKQIFRTNGLNWKVVDLSNVEDRPASTTVEQND